MRCLPAVALLSCCFVALPTHAQRGGGRGGGGHASGGFHGGFGGSARGSFGPRSASVGVHSGRPGVYRGAYGPGPFIRPYQRFGGAARFGGAISGYRPGRGGYGPGYGRYPVRRLFGYSRSFYPGYAFPGVVSFGYTAPFWDFADNLGYDQPPYGAQPDYPGPENSAGAYATQPADPYAEQPPDVYQAQPAQPNPAPTDGSQPMVYAPYAYSYPASPQVTVVTLPPPQREEDAVTIFYRDGRPPEQIRNYALTRSALVITGERLREIPLRDIDLPLTQRVNRAVGIDFRLPDPN